MLPSYLIPRSRVLRCNSSMMASTCIASCHLFRSLLAGVLLVLVAGSSSEGKFQSPGQQAWDRFVEQLATATPEQASLLRERAQALGDEFFRQNLYEPPASPDDLTRRRRRHLQTTVAGPLAALNLTAPTRECGEIIATLSLVDLQTVVDAFVKNLIPANSSLGSFTDLALNFLSSTLKYGIQVQKICSSCEQVHKQYAGASFLTDTTSNVSFGTFCGSKKYGYNVTTSGLLILPIDPATGKVFTKILRSAIFTHATTAGSQRAPSGSFPSNITATLTQSNSTLVMSAAMSLLDIVPGIIGASAGAVAILPDFIGYGESYDYPKGYLIYSLYQQASVSLWLAARHLLTSAATTNASCTVLDNVVTVSGYSEGGYSAFSSCLAFNQLTIDGSKVRVLRCQSGGTPFDLDYIVSHTFEQLQNQSSHRNGPAVTVYFGNAYSSTDSDLANTNKGQDALISPYKEKAPVWLDTPSLSGVVALASAAGPLNISNPNFVNLYLSLNSTTPVRACSGPGLENIDTKYLCQAIVDNALVNPLLTADFPTIICHAPDDTLVPFANIPNFSSNPNVKLYSPILPMLAPSGDHSGGTLYCAFATIIAFASPDDQSDSSQLISNATVPASACIASNSTKAPSSPTQSPPTQSPPPPSPPTQSPPTPSSKPSSGIKLCMSGLPSLLSIAASAMLLV